ncbi:hypothetical protein [Streptomyces sp. NPDC048277]
MEAPTRLELERCFSLDDVDRDLIALRRTARCSATGHRTSSGSSTGNRRA